MSIQKIKREELDSLIQDASVRTKRKPTDLEKKEGMKRFLKQNRADQKSEYIAGETIMHSPAVAFHTVVRKNIEMYIHEHIGTTGKGMVQSEKAAIIFGYNVFEPDVVYWNETVNIEKKTLVHPIPHFIAEVLSPSTKGRDRTLKKNNYEKSQVQEYWIVDTDKQTIQQYVIDKETKKYVLHKTYFEKDTIESVAIEGFYVSLEAVFSYRMPSGPYKIILQKRAEEILKKSEQEKQQAIEREQQA
ncbi:MAG: Uma2 family endonuclease, partial [Chitinophagaceae bacterium]|nr:Uma2 family endonuclease [Chitinophagaceae bacterium]